MASTYSTNLALELIGTGDQSGTWGTTTNTNLGTLIEQAISGYTTTAMTTDADTAISIPNGASGEARNMYIEIPSTLTLTANRVLTVPSGKSKLYFVYNNSTGGYAVTVKVSGQTGVSVPNGKKMALVCNGTDVYVAENYFASLTLGSALPVTSGGTGGTSITANSVVLGNGTGALGGNLVAPGASGNLLTSNGTTWTSAAAPTSFVSGMLMPYAGSSAPTGWLLCYGQAVSRTTYSSLFSAIGSTYGSGDGSTTFNLPDFRGRVAAGQDNMGGVAASRLTTAVSGVDGTTVGASGGDQRQQSHTHTATVTDPGHSHTYTSVAGAGGGGNIQSGGGSPTAPSTSSQTTGISVANSTTGAGSSQNVQPTLVVTYIIKY